MYSLFFFAVYVLHDNMHWTDRIMQMTDFPQRRTCGCADFHVFAEAAFEITARFHVPRLFARPNCTPFCSLVWNLLIARQLYSTPLNNGSDRERPSIFFTSPPRALPLLLPTFLPLSQSCASLSLNPPTQTSIGAWRDDPFPNANRVIFHLVP